MKTLFTKSIVIQLHPSPLLLGLLLAVATIASLVLVALPIILTIKLVFFALIILSSTYFIARDALLIMPSSWIWLEVDTKGVLSLVNKRQQLFKPQLAASTFVHEHCVILNLKNQSFSWMLPPVLLFNNVENIDALRRLRVWLRLYKNKRPKQKRPHSSQLMQTQTVNE